MTSAEAEKIIKEIDNMYMKKISRIPYNILNSCNETCLFLMRNGMFLKFQRKFAQVLPNAILYKEPPDENAHYIYGFQLLDKNKCPISEDVNPFEMKDRIDMALARLVEQIRSKIDMFD